MVVLVPCLSFYRTILPCVCAVLYAPPCCFNVKRLGAGEIVHFVNGIGVRSDVEAVCSGIDIIGIVVVSSTISRFDCHHRYFFFPTWWCE